MPPKRAKKDEDVDSDEEFEESSDYRPKSKRNKGPAAKGGSKNEDDLSDGSDSEDEVTSRPTMSRGRSTRAAAQKATQVVSRVAKRDANNTSDEEEEEEEEEEPIEEEPELETPFGLKWTDNGTLHYLTSDEVKPSEKIVGFDMDGTLIDTKSKAKFPKSREDWKWFLDEVPKKLQELHDNGYKIVIFTNQAGVEKNHVRLYDLKGKIIDIIQELKFPIQAIISTHTDANRKPNTTMWKFFEKNLNGDVAVDKTQSTFVGDAGGRPKEWKKGKKKDFSCSDRAFASNIGLPFKTPEEYFLGEEAAIFEWDSIDPAVLLESIDKDAKAYTGEEPVASDKQELVVLVGRPASGKSTFAKKHLIPAGYVHVNQDTLKTKDKCIKAAREALNNGKSVVIDNTNPTPEIRREYLALAKEKAIPVRCYYFETDIGLSHHLNFYREKIQGTRRVPDVGFNTYKSKFKEPNTEEGFVEVKKITFVPDFASEEHKQLFLERT